jgi:hypothetical protein
MVKVKLNGLNIVRARGKWYVYHRESKEILLKGFEGSPADLERRLAEPDLIAAYNSRRTRDLKRIYPEGTLGALVNWFETECPTFAKLADATRKDYTAAFAYLRPEFDAPLASITQPALYEVRDRCAAQKWPRFADKMMSALSSMFSQAVKRGKMPTNPAKGIDKAHKTDKNANREWLAEEWTAATANAPTEIMIALMLARYVGFRGQTIASVQWKNYQPDARFGKCFRHVAKKNAEQSWVPVAPELQAYLDGLNRTSLNIATRTGGTPWTDEKEMQTAVSHYLRRLEKDGLIGTGTTLHGLRVSYAAELGRGGASDGDVAAALGDRSERMGKHYTRHVENEARVIRAFEGKKKP